jgi:hypothetical protein
VALAALELDGRDLLRAGAARHHGDEAQAQQAREVGLAHRGGAAGGLDHGPALVQPAVAQRMQEQAARETVLQAAGGVAGLVLQVQLHTREAGQRQRDQVRVAAALEVGLDAADGLAHPGAALAEVRRRHETSRRSQSGMGTVLPCGMFSHTVVAPPVA